MNVTASIPATLHVLRDSTRSTMIAESVEDAIIVAIVGEGQGEFRAIEITDWNGGTMDEDTLRREINRRLVFQ